MGVEMIQDLIQKKCPIKSLTMDNDSTTIQRVRAVHGNITKLSNTNHTKKGIINALYELKKSHKELCSSKTVNYIAKMIMYGVHQKQGDVLGLRGRLEQIVPHVFGDHTKCDAAWCGHHKDPENYTDKSLPFKRPLSNSALRIDLEKFISQYQSKAGKLAFLGSSQANEAFNTTVASKAPKSR